MFKKISVVFSAFLLCSCGLLQKDTQSVQRYDYQNSKPQNTVELTDYSQVDLGSSQSFRVAMLLPLSGKAEAMGKSMKNAAMMAVGDLNNNNLVLQFYDTKGTTSGARVAVENVINAKSDLILGPLLGDEVAAITGMAQSEGIPVISFSSSPNVLRSGIYTLGLLNEEQIDRIIKYAASKGRLRLAVVLPDNQSGINMFKAVAKSAQTHGVTLVKAGFYPPETMDFTSLVTQMAGEDRVKASQAKANEPKIESELDFDVLLVPEFGNRLKSITSMFSFYDVSAPEVLFMGTSVWANTNLNKETELYGAVYPVMSLSRHARFFQKYNQMFEERPNGLSIFAYDAVALASALSRKDKDNLTAEITNLDGFYGMSGAFRIFDNGKNEHGLDVVKVTASGQQVIEPAERKFYSANPSYAQSYANEPDYAEHMPQIFGKDAEALRQILLNVQ